MAVRIKVSVKGSPIKAGVPGNWHLICAFTFREKILGFIRQASDFFDPSAAQP
jgi:hypothetical protein